MMTGTATARRDPDARGYFGEFGGRFVPETLVEPVEELASPPHGDPLAAQIDLQESPADADAGRQQEARNAEARAQSESAAAAESTTSTSLSDATASWIAVAIAPVGSSPATVHPF